MASRLELCLRASISTVEVIVEIVKYGHWYFENIYEDKVPIRIRSVNSQGHTLVWRHHCLICEMSFTSLKTFIPLDLLKPSLAVSYCVKIMTFYR